MTPINITTPQSAIDRLDGITATSSGPALIENTVIDFGDLPLTAQDGGIDCVEGADVVLRNCIIRNVGKAMLCGNEEMPHMPVNVLMEDCVLDGCGRRCPEAQYMTFVTMRRCLIRNWGGRFNVRSFGAWAHHGAHVIAEDCVFWQDAKTPFFTGHFLADLTGHIGQAWNDKSRRLRDYLLPGLCRGLTAGPGGNVRAENCWKNRWWIQIENHSGGMPEARARAIIAGAGPREE
jgi:hypothetical protein